MINENDQRNIDLLSIHEQRLKQDPNDTEARHFLGLTSYIIGNQLISAGTGSNEDNLATGYYWERAVNLLHDHITEKAILLYRLSLLKESASNYDGNYEYFEKALDFHLSVMNLDPWILYESERVFRESGKFDENLCSINKLYLAWCRKAVRIHAPSDGKSSSILQKGLAYWRGVLRSYIPYLQPENLKTYANIANMMLYGGEATYAFDIMNRHLHLLEYIDNQNFDQELYKKWIKYYQNAINIAGYQNADGKHRLVFMHFSDRFKNHVRKDREPEKSINQKLEKIVDKTSKESSLHLDALGAGQAEESVSKRVYLEAPDEF